MKLLVAVVIFVVSSWVFVIENSPGQSVEETKPKIEEPQLNKTKSGEDYPVVGAVEVKSVASQQEPNNGTDKKKTNSDEPVDYQWWFNLFLVILTGGLVVTGTLQFCVYKEQARYMRDGLEINRQSVKAAQDSADAAKKSAQVSEDALKLTERAYLIIGRWQWSQPEAAHPGSISYSLVNSGRTHAEVFGSYTERCIDRRPATIASNYRQHLIKWQGLTIAAQETHQVHVDRNDPIIPTRWEQIRGAVIQLYVFTHVEYDDVFGERYEVGCLVRYDSEARQFLIHNDTVHNYHRKKSQQ
jgi:hypothetical protein